VAAGDGFSVTALSTDGNTLAVGAPGRDGGAGAVYLFSRAGVAWTQQALLSSPLPHPRDRFGEHLALSGDGHTLAVGAAFEASAATGVSSTPSADVSSPNAGAVYTFTRDGGAWSPEAYLKSTTGGAGYFSTALALAADGQTLAVGEPGNGAVEVYVRTPAWAHSRRLPGGSAGFGASVALTADGHLLAVGDPDDKASTTGPDGGAAGGGPGSGAVSTFVRSAGSAGTWASESSFKASSTLAGDRFGWRVALSGTGALLAVGAPLESSTATGVNGVPASGVSAGSGAVYVYVR
jgi:hypothetical protein